MAPGRLRLVAFLAARLGMAEITAILHQLEFHVDFGAVETLPGIVMCFGLGIFCYFPMAIFAFESFFIFSSGSSPVALKASGFHVRHELPGDFRRIFHSGMAFGTTNPGVVMVCERKNYIIITGNLPAQRDWLVHQDPAFIGLPFRVIRPALILVMTSGAGIYHGRLGLVYFHASHVAVRATKSRIRMQLVIERAVDFISQGEMDKRAAACGKHKKHCYNPCYLFSSIIACTHIATISISEIVRIS